MSSTQQGPGTPSTKPARKAGATSPDVASNPPIGNQVYANGQTATSFSLSITENNGCCVLTASATGPIPDGTWVGLYDNTFPSNPNTGYLSDGWFYLMEPSQVLQTKEPFGSNYLASINIMTSPPSNGQSGTYAYGVQVGPT